MSTILEALKKSEQERKLNKLPTLSDMPAPEEQSNWPLRVLIVLLVIMLGFLFWWLFGWLDSDEVDSTNQKQKRIVLSNDTLEADRLVGDSQLEADTTPANTAKGSAIVVNVVSYSEQAEQRFVMINAKLYREGEFVRTGLKVEQIKPDSVVLNHRGKRLERQP